jgi:hypothetical protein
MVRLQVGLLCRDVLRRVLLRIGLLPVVLHVALLRLRTDAARALL